MEGSSDEVLLLVLDLHHLALDRVVCDVLVDEHVLVLAEPVHSVKALPLAGGVPGRVKQEEVVGRGEIETNATSLDSRRIYLYRNQINMNLPSNSREAPWETLSPFFETP